MLERCLVYIRKFCKNNFIYSRMSESTDPFLFEKIQMVKSVGLMLN